ncbi:MAG: M48 family metalloprotease [Candidatus Omnitrophica bacterium]|nr:M48 family metalloprotease [Candidatus Omnitrophota bacterium]
MKLEIILAQGVCLVLCFTGFPFITGFMQTTYNSATEKDEFILVSTEKEKNIGASVAKQVEKEYKETDDPLMEKHVEELGARIASVNERKDLTYRFKVLKAKNDDDYNAFSLPGGYVYIFDAFVKKMNNDDEVAGVLAHEVGHIAAKHSIKRLQGGLGMDILMLLGMGIGATGGNVENPQEAMAALSLLMAAYSREDEMEADALSIKYLKESKFDPQGVVNALEFLQKARKKAPLRNYTFFRSHPYVSERISHARTLANDKGDFDAYINMPVHEDGF